MTMKKNIFTAQSLIKAAFCMHTTLALGTEGYYTKTQINKMSNCIS